uniref:RNA polymerase, sigma-24 subunit, ECF subfamily n=1 Tax=Solibacter usitatus (strain Ellin6076) TaxID=234267 RepID=Q021X5_SOLUE
MTGQRSITLLLLEWNNGNPAALEELTPHVYRELHTLARWYLSRGGPNRTLQPTALINEVYLRLIENRHPVEWESRSHFIGIAARLMRNVLVECSRSRGAAKRGGSAIAVTLDETVVPSSGRGPDVLELDEALDRLAQRDERKAKVIELHYFGGMTREEIAGAMNLTVATVKRDLRLGEAWLRCHLSGGDSGRNGSR